jgi:cytochrome bd ubiquinol oxidase subunit I
VRYVEPDFFCASRGRPTTAGGRTTTRISRGNVWHNLDEIHGNGKDDDHNGWVDDYYGINIPKGSESGIDDDGHGTHVAGIIAGHGNNAMGVAGACWSAAAGREARGGKVPAGSAPDVRGGLACGRMEPLLLAAAGLAGGLGDASQPDLLWAREMQALSFAIHIPLTCFGMAFPAMVLFAEGLWLRTGDQAYRALAKRWSKVMLILFAVGVVTGTILSFELGLLWPNFMATFGEVFGLAFGLEGFSFFIEAIFIAIYVYGWDRLPPRAHLLSGLPILVAGATGSLFVISVNGWMNHPVGFDVAGGEVVNVRPWAALFNENFWHEYVHMYFAAYMVVGFLVASVYARAWLRGERGRYVRAGLVIPLTFAAFTAPVQVIAGDWAGRTVADLQPTKLATFEGLAETTEGAPFHIGGWYEDDGDIKAGIEIPRLLSVLAAHDRDAAVEVLDAVAPADRPGPVNTVRFAFQTMVGIGTLLAAMGLFYAALWWRNGRLPRSPWFFRLVVAAGPLAVVALICGWVTTEVGRQPWVVYRVMRTEDAVTGAGGLPVAFAAVAVVYLALIATVVWLLRRLASRPPDVEVPGTLERT